MSAPRKRLTIQQSQEHRSKGQLDDRLSEYGWICNPVVKDHGEDHLVQIYDNGVSTGLAFMVQLKSTRSLNALRLDSTPDLISYPLAAKDLEHWSKSTTLVVLMVWDVQQRSGRWQTVNEILASLRHTNRKWRTQKKINAHVPWANGTNDDGLKRLRRVVADHNLPLVRRPKWSRYSISFTFPTDAHGKAAFATLRNAIDTGEPVKIDGEFISEFRYPTWYRRLYGESPKPVSLEISPRPSDKRLRVRIEIDSVDASASVPHVELRPVRVGKRQATLTNEHQDPALRFTLIWDKLDGGAANVTLSLKKVKWGSTVYEEREALAFLLACRSGGSLRVVDLETGQTILSAQRPHGEADYETDEMVRKLALMVKLCFIQQRIASVGTLSLAKGISRDDLRTVDYLISILNGESIPAVASFSGMMTPSRGIGEIVDGPITFHRTNVRIKFLNLEVPVGTAVSTLVDPMEFLRVIRERTQRARDGKSINLAFKRLAVTEQFPDVLAAKGLPPDPRGG